MEILDKIGPLVAVGLMVTWITTLWHAAFRFWGLVDRVPRKLQRLACFAILLLAAMAAPTNSISWSTFEGERWTVRPTKNAVALVPGDGQRILESGTTQWWLVYRVDTAVRGDRFDGTETSSAISRTLFVPGWLLLALAAYWMLVLLRRIPRQRTASVPAYQS